jgi:hypothetical protein
MWRAAMLAMLAGSSLAAQAQATAIAPNEAVMLTVHLKHDQSRPLGELREQLDQQGFYKAFPPEGVEVVSWTVAMGIGQVVVLRLPASRLAEVNLALENTAWGAYRTAFFPTYDLKDAARARVMEAREVK